jgi:hypothetical protein
MSDTGAFKPRVITPSRTIRVNNHEHYDFPDTAVENYQHTRNDKTFQLFIFETLEDATKGYDKIMSVQIMSEPSHENGVYYLTYPLFIRSADDENLTTEGIVEYINDNCLVNIIDSKRVLPNITYMRVNDKNPKIGKVVMDLHCDYETLKTTENPKYKFKHFNTTNKNHQHSNARVPNTTQRPPRRNVRKIARRGEGDEPVASV